MNDGMKSAVKLMREKGMGIKQIARELQIGVGTVYSVIWIPNIEVKSYADLSRRYDNILFIFHTNLFNLYFDVIKKR